MSTAYLPLRSDDFTALDAFLHDLGLKVLVPADIERLLAADNVLHGSLEVFLAVLAQIDVCDIEKRPRRNRIGHFLLADITILNFHVALLCEGLYCNAMIPHRCSTCK